MGNKVLMDQHKIDTDNYINTIPTTLVYMAIERKLVAVFQIMDQIKPEAKETIANFRESNIENIVMLSGENLQNAKHMGDILGIDAIVAEVLPDEKLAYITKLQREGKAVAYVGDGINDGPALVQRDVGISMGRLQMLRLRLQLLF